MTATAIKKQTNPVILSLSATGLFALLLGLRESDTYGHIFSFVPILGGNLPFFTLAVLLTLIYRASGGTLKDLGFGWPQWKCSKRKMVLYIALWAIALFVIRMLEGALLAPLLEKLGPGPETFARMAPLVGNLSLLMTLLPVMWLVVVGEEVLFRGLILNYLANKLGGSGMSWVIAIVISATLFGLGHFWQGPRGMLSTGMGALVMGAGYYLSGRTLWPVIFAHAIGNTLGFIAIYMGE